MPTLFRAVGATGGTPRSLTANGLLNQYMTLELPVGTDYVVPAGKTFKITRILFGGAAGGAFIIGYGDNGVAKGAAAPTAWVEVIGKVADSASVLIATIASTLYGVDIYAEIPAGKYPCAYGYNDMKGLQVIGVEETA